MNVSWDVNPTMNHNRRQRKRKKIAISISPLPYWERFVQRGANWKATQNSVLCQKHFEAKLVNISEKRAHLDWKSDPVPTIYLNEIYTKYPSTLPTPVIVRKPPKKRSFQEDEMPKFLNEVDPVINNVFDLEQHSPKGFTCRKLDDCLLFYRLEFDAKTQFPKILESIKVDKDLHVQLQYNGEPIPLPPWFIESRQCNARLTRVSMLDNLPSYIRNVASETPFSLLDELKSRKNYKPKGQPPYSAAMLRFALHLRYTSAQAYRLLLEKFPLPSFSLLSKIQRGGVDAIKSIQLLREKGEISRDVILMVDEMFLQKAAQYQAGEYVGADDEGNLYKGIVAFMIVGLKKSVPFIIQALPEITFDGAWLSEKIAENLQILSDAGFCVRAIVADNHSSNVRAFSSLRQRFESDSPYYFKHLSNNKKIYLFYDNVHLIKNIRNNLLNGKKFVFPSFYFDDGNIKVACPAGYITWSDLHRIYDKDSQLKANLRKAPKLTYCALHPGNKKQSVSLALSLFEETTIAASRDYFPEREDMASFLGVIQKWWLIANSKERYHPNPLGNAAVAEDGKTIFFRTLADWIEEWQMSPAFTLTSQTSTALISTLRAQAMLIDDLLGEAYDEITEEGYKYVLIGRLQSDPLERRFSQYRQMSGGRFLVSLREVRSSERILACRSLLMEDVDFWRENLHPVQSSTNIESLLVDLDAVGTEIQESALDSDSREVATFIAGYISKKLDKRSKCLICKDKLFANEDGVANDKYLNSLSRGGLVVPSGNLADFVDSCFAILDYVSELIQKHQIVNVREVSTLILNRYAPKVDFTCINHIEWGFKFATKPIINSFFNNKEKIDSDSVRKDCVAEFKRTKRRKSN